MSPQLSGIGGVYCENCDVAPIDDSDPSTTWAPEDATRIPGVMPFAIDSKSARHSWELSEKLLGIKSGF